MIAPRKPRLPTTPWGRPYANVLPHDRPAKTSTPHDALGKALRERTPTQSPQENLDSPRRPFRRSTRTYSHMIASRKPRLPTTPSRRLYANVLPHDRLKKTSTPHDAFEKAPRERTPTHSGKPSTPHDAFEKALRERTPTQSPQENLDKPGALRPRHYANVRAFFPVQNVRTHFFERCRCVNRPRLRRDWGDYVHVVAERETRGSAEEETSVVS
jgi:hypothetical protein